jgi:hypothetical protein
VYGCESGWLGEKCDEKYIGHCLNDYFDKITGYCKHGCKIGLL